MALNPSAPTVSKLYVILLLHIYGKISVAVLKASQISSNV